MTHPADGLERHPDETDRAYEHRKHLVCAAAVAGPVSPEIFKWLQTGDPEKMPEKVRRRLHSDGDPSGGIGNG